MATAIVAYVESQSLFKDRRAGREYDAPIPFLMTFIVKPQLRSPMLRLACLASLSITLSTSAVAQHDDHGTEQEMRGLGQKYPNARNQSLDPAWRLYEFERDGISYYQVSDNEGRIQLIIAKAADSFWTLPAGDTAARISLPSRPQHMIQSFASMVVYRSSEFALTFHDDGINGVWAVETVY